MQGTERSKTGVLSRNTNAHYLAKCLIIYLHGSQNGALCFTESEKKMPCPRERAFQTARARSAAVRKVCEIGGHGYV